MPKSNMLIINTFIFNAVNISGEELMLSPDIVYIFNMIVFINTYNSSNLCNNIKIYLTSLNYRNKSKYHKYNL